MPLEIVRNDICRMAVDAIVNSANPSPVIGRGVDSALHEAAGPTLLEERRRAGNIAVGAAIATGAGCLPARYVIHTVGPLWQGGGAGELDDVARCYRSCLDAAVRLGCASIAFPLISTGTYGFPKSLALRAATDEISAFLADTDLDVYLVVYDEESFQISQDLFDKVADYLDRRLEPSDTVASSARRMRTLRSASAVSPDTPQAFDGLLEEASIEFDSFEAFPYSIVAAEAALPGDSASPSERRSDVAQRRRLLSRRRLEDVVSEVDESFAEALLRLIDERGMTDPQVYKRANIDRKLFSKIRSNAGYRPSKATAVALAVALMLNLDETRDLIARAGYALTRASRGDIIVEYFIENGIWDVIRINEALFAFDEPLIGR